MKKAIRTTGWCCCICENVYKTETEAKDCCSFDKQFETYLYKCRDCEKLYLIREKAEECQFLGQKTNK